MEAMESSFFPPGEQSVPFLNYGDGAMHRSSAYPSLGSRYVSDETFQGSFDNHVPEVGDAWNFEHEGEMSTSARKNSTAAGASCRLVVVAA